MRGLHHFAVIPVAKNPGSTVIVVPQRLLLSFRRVLGAGQAAIALYSLAFVFRVGDIVTTRTQLCCSTAPSKPLQAHGRFEVNRETTHPACLAWRFRHFFSKDRVLESSYLEMYMLLATG